MTAVLDADTVGNALTTWEAIDGITNALRAGLQPATQPPRSNYPIGAGQLLLMPGYAGRVAGVKVLGLAPGNRERGLPYISGSFLLLNATTLSPLAILDAAALTSVRTPAVSFAGILHALSAGQGPLDVVIFGAGTQGLAHQDMLRDVCTQAGRPLGDVTIATRDQPPGPQELASAGLVICATNARTPLFPENAVGPDVIVVAVGSHEPDTTEIDPFLLRGAQVVVEDRATAIRESGEIGAAISAGILTPTDLIELADVINGHQPAPQHGRTVLKTTGMAWEDVVIAHLIARKTGILP